MGRGERWWSATARERPGEVGRRCWSREKRTEGTGAGEAPTRLTRVGEEGRLWWKKVEEREEKLEDEEAKAEEEAPVQTA